MFIPELDSRSNNNKKEGEKFISLTSFVAITLKKLKIILFFNRYSQWAKNLGIFNRKN
jgi:hypothetical protein